MAAFDEQPGLRNGSVAGGAVSLWPVAAAAWAMSPARAGWSHPVTLVTIWPALLIKYAVGTEIRP